MFTLRIVAPLLAAAALLAGCGRSADSGTSHEKIGMHEAVPPHGGTGISVGDDYSVELVLDAQTGVLSAYVLDDDMEEFIRSTSRSVTLTAQAGGAEHRIVLAPVPNPATGETVGDSALFQGQADWLKKYGAFEGVIEGLTIRGTQFDGIKFKFPNNNDKG